MGCDMGMGQMMLYLDSLHLSLGRQFHGHLPRAVDSATEMSIVVFMILCLESFECVETIQNICFNSAVSASI